jgi:hypothetical protein
MCIFLMDINYWSLWVNVFILIIYIIIAIIGYIQLVAMKKGNNENARLNRLQAVENTILKQLEFHYNLLNRIKVNYGMVGKGFGYPDAPTDAYGQEAFELFYDILKQNYETMPGFFKDDMADEERRIKDSFTQLYKVYGGLFGNYFKNLYLLIKYINDIKIEGFERHYYIDLVKSQLSKYELLVLAYDCIWIQDKPKGENFIELARDNKLLSALEEDELIKPVSSVNHATIFKERYGIVFGRPVEFTN